MWGPKPHSIPCEAQGPRWWHSVPFFATSSSGFAFLDCCWTLPVHYNFTNSSLNSNTLSRAHSFVYAEWRLTFFPHVYYFPFCCTYVCALARLNALKDYSLFRKVPHVLWSSFRMLFIFLSRSKFFNFLPEQYVMEYSDYQNSTYFCKCS